jgi:hypothetical protein
MPAIMKCHHKDTHFLGLVNLSLSAYYLYDSFLCSEFAKHSPCHKGPQNCTNLLFLRALFFSKSINKFFHLIISTCNRNLKQPVSLKYQLNTCLFNIKISFVIFIKWSSLKLRNYLSCHLKDILLSCENISFTFSKLLSRHLLIWTLLAFPL